MMEYLAYARAISDDVYGLYFTKDTDEVWGNEWNVSPSGIIPGIDVDHNCLSSSFQIICPEGLMTAGQNTCFSMQDCIDGIYPMIWSPLGTEDTIYSEDRPFFAMFGEEKEEVAERARRYGMEPCEERSYEDKAEEIMNSMLDDLDNIGNSGGNNDEDLEF